jgi:hypothetical protein
MEAWITALLLHYRVLLHRCLAQAYHVHAAAHEIEFFWTHQYLI